jgi:hypothetical protein
MHGSTGGGMTSCMIRPMCGRYAEFADKSKTEYEI